MSMRFERLNSKVKTQVKFPTNTLTQTYRLERQSYLISVDMSNYPPQLQEIFQRFLQFNDVQLTSWTFFFSKQREARNHEDQKPKQKPWHSKPRRSRLPIAMCLGNCLENMLRSLSTSSRVCGVDLTGWNLVLPVFIPPANSVGVCYLNPSQL